MKTILIANPKGGSGKTTLAVNIAGFLANRGERVALLDMDLQQSAALWLSLRPDYLPAVREIKHGKEDGSSNWLVIDSGAGLSGSNFAFRTHHSFPVRSECKPGFFEGSGRGKESTRQSVPYRRHRYAHGATNPRGPCTAILPLYP